MDITGSFTIYSPNSSSTGAFSVSRSSSYHVTTNVTSDEAMANRGAFLTASRSWTGEKEV